MHLSSTEVTGATSEWTDLAPDSSHKRVLDEWKESQSIDKGCEFAAAGLWADSATCHTRDSLFLVLFNILSGVFHHRLWVCAYSKRMACNCGCKGRCTFTDIWRVIVWSFGCNQAGRHPKFRDDGVTPFAKSVTPSCD